MFFQNSSLPWTEPKKGFALDFGELRDAFSGVFGVSCGIYLKLFFTYIKLMPKTDYG
jgi:hypothetical protein